MKFLALALMSGLASFGQNAAPAPKVFLLENQELPLTIGFVLFRTANLFDPKDKIELAELTGTAMRSGGTKEKRAEVAK